MTYQIVGCGDVGRRIARYLIEQGVESESIRGWVNSEASAATAKKLGISASQCDLDANEPLTELAAECHQTQIFYTVAPAKAGLVDDRAKRFLQALSAYSALPKKITLISTTGVYGDCGGEWVDESRPLNPTADRAKRRVSLEQQFANFAVSNTIDLAILRVPGIYARSRLPEKRVRAGEPVLRASECGFTNRIHADDLAAICVRAQDCVSGIEVFNASDGRPGNITEYLQAVAKFFALPPLPEINLEQAREQLSAGMLSYLGESRKISNAKMPQVLDYELLYPDFKKGIRFKVYEQGKHSHTLLRGITYSQ